MAVKVSLSIFVFVKIRVNAVKRGKLNQIFRKNRETQKKYCDHTRFLTGYPTPTFSKKNLKSFFFLYPSDPSSPTIGSLPLRLPDRWPRRWGNRRSSSRQRRLGGPICPGPGPLCPGTPAKRPRTGKHHGGCDHPSIHRSNDDHAFRHGSEDQPMDGRTDGPITLP